MYESLLLETGGGIISKNQVSPQQGDACVMIGIGGTGVAALRKLKKAVYQHIEPDENTKDSVPKYEKIKFLTIDTDETELGRDNSDASAIGPNEQFSIHEPFLLKLLADPAQLNKDGNLGWMNASNIKMGGAQGAGGVRQVGRYCLMKKSNELKAKISALIVDAKAAAGTAEVNVHIFAGISGGTGSGCFLDVCYIVRDILESMSGNIFGYFFLPDIHLHRKGIMGQEAIENWNKQNGYAAFRELDYLMSLPSSNEIFEANYGSFVVRSSEPPVDLCHLISGTNSKGVVIDNAYDYALNVVVDYVLSYLSKVVADNETLQSDKSGLTIAGHLANVKTGIKMIKPKYGAERDYHILGASSAELPLTHIGTYLAGKTYGKLILNLGKSSSNDIVLNVANNMGYNFEGMRKLLIDGVNFNPAYNMDTIDNPGRLNETANDWSVAIPGIAVPINNCMQAAKGKILTNEKAQTQELQSYDYQKLSNVENPTFAVRLFNQLVMCCLGVNSGPTMAAELLHSESSKDLTNIMDGIIAEANEKQKSYETNLELRVQDICTAAHNYNKAHTGKRRKLLKYLETRNAMLTCQIEIEVCKKVASMCSSFKIIISTLYANYFSPMRTMISELDDTFKANIEWLDTPEKLINKDYCWRIFELSDIRDTLDETVLKQQQMDVEHSEFVSYLIAHFNEWKSQDKYRTARCINEYMINHFDETLSQTVDDFLMVKFNQTDKAKLAEQIQNAVINKVRSKADPLFWTSPYFTIDNYNTYRHSVMSIPNVSTVIGLASENIGDPTMVIRKCNIGDRITCLNFVSGIPLFAYQGVYSLKNVYEKAASPGMHLHEKDINWKEVLPTPIPYRVDKNATKDGKEKVKLYYEAVQNKVICCSGPDNPEEYVVRLIPNQMEKLNKYTKEKFVFNGNILESDLLNAISELKTLRSSLLTDNVPESQRITLKNDGFVGDEVGSTPEEKKANDFTERVRIDYFVRFGGVREAAKKSLDNLKKIDDKIAEMESWRDEPLKAKKLVERYMRLFVTGKISYDNNKKTERLNYKSKGYTASEVLSDLTMPYCLFRRYQSYLNLNRMNGEILKELDEELEIKLKTPEKQYGFEAGKIVEELNDKAMSDIKQNAETDVNCYEILQFYKTLKELSQQLHKLLGPYDDPDPRLKELKEKLKALENAFKQGVIDEISYKKQKERIEAEMNQENPVPIPDPRLKELREKLEVLKNAFNQGVIDEISYKKQKERIEAEMNQENPVPIPVPEDPRLKELREKLKQLENLFNQGLLDEDVYKMQKEKIEAEIEKISGGGETPEIKEIKNKMEQLKSLLASGMIAQDMYDLSMQGLEKQLKELESKKEQKKDSTSDSLESKLAQLKQLVDMGVLDQVSYEKQKNDLLAQYLGI